MSASSTPIKAAFKFLKTHSKKEKSRITITSISKEKRDDDDAVNSIGPTSGETSSGSSDEQVILVSHDPPHCSVDPSSTCIDKNIPNYLSTPSDSNVLALPWNKDQVEEKTAFSIEEEKPSYYKVMTCGLDTFFDSLFFTPNDNLGNDNGGKIINNINGHSNTVALQQNFEQGSPTNAEAEGDAVEDTFIGMRNSNITTSEKVESQTHQYIHDNNSHGLTSSKCLEQNPNCNEFATVYHSYRVHSQFCKEILSKTYTTIPCFFEANNTKRAIHVCSEPLASNYNVRSQNYIQNGSKEPSKDSLFAFLGMDSLLNNNGVTEHASSDKFSFRNQMKQASRTNNVACPFLLVINWIVPWGNLQTYFCRPIESQSTSFVSNSSMSGASAGEKLWNQFLTEMTDVSCLFTFQKICQKQTLSTPFHFLISPAFRSSCCNKGGTKSSIETYSASSRWPMDVKENDWFETRIIRKHYQYFILPRLSRRGVFRNIDQRYKRISNGKYNCKCL